MHPKEKASPVRRAGRSTEPLWSTQGLKVIPTGATPGAHREMPVVAARIRMLSRTIKIQAEAEAATAARAAWGARTGVPHIPRASLWLADWGARRFRRPRRVSCWAAAAEPAPTTMALARVTWASAAVVRAAAGLFSFVPEPSAARELLAPTAQTRTTQCSTTAQAAAARVEALSLLPLQQERWER